MTSACWESKLGAILQQEKDKALNMLRSSLGSAQDDCRRYRVRRFCFQTAADRVSGGHGPLAPSRAPPPPHPPFQDGSADEQRNRGLARPVMA